MGKLDNLEGFSGSDTIYTWSSIFPNYALTDGARYVAKEAGAYWLMDLIASYFLKPAVRREEFQVWTLTVKDSAGSVKCDDGNGRVVARQRIEYTDFPLNKIVLWCIKENDTWVIKLPTEY